MSLFSRLEELQWKQLQHDEKYHKEIWLLTVQQRITHMTLHLAKYSSAITVAALENDKPAFEKAIIDTFIITMSSANIFGTRIHDIALNDLEQKCHDTRELASLLLDKFHSEFAGASLLEFNKQISINIGRMCKAAESLDHLEVFPYRETMVKSLASLFRITLCAFEFVSDAALEERISKRLMAVERKNIFFSKLGNYESGY
ncbi:hypothetical protein QIW46_04620 [Pseudomonas fluorescens]|uniref:hypothetical protein n=1 Tax=Pseudomonas fluorescens TaxID=294 RepID=UPI0035265E5C